MKYLLLVFLALTITSCRTMIPPPHTVVTDPYLREQCAPAGSPGTFRAVHVIHAAIQGKTSSFIGITIADVPTDRIRATLLSVEGLVLLDAVDNKGHITIYQAMDPFHSEIFARGLFDDIKFMFFPLQGELVQAKIKDDGSVTCTWMDNGREFEKDAAHSGETVVSEYDSEHRVIRQVKLFPPLVKGFYTHIRMDSYGMRGYSLSFELLEAEPLEHVDGLFAR
jgi:hypothetical protein